MYLQNVGLHWNMQNSRLLTKTIPKIGPYHIDDYKTMQNDSGLTKFANDLSVSHKFWPYLNYIYVDGNCGLWNVPLPFND